MKHHIVRTIAFATLLLGLAAAASAQEGRTCSITRVAGDWGYSLTGTFVLPTGAVPVAFIGSWTTDAAGNLSGRQTSNVGGAVAQDTLMGTVTVNSDCTGTLTVGLYNQSGNLLRTAVWAIVYIDDAREVRGTFKSLVLSNGMSVPAIAIGEGKRLFQNHGNEQ